VVNTPCRDIYRDKWSVCSISADALMFGPVEIYDRIDPKRTASLNLTNLEFVSFSSSHQKVIYFKKVQSLAS
jgi:hypothetical protein